MQSRTKLYFLLASNLALPGASKRVDLCSGSTSSPYMSLKEMVVPKDSKKHLGQLMCEEHPSRVGVTHSLGQVGL